MRHKYQVKYKDILLRPLHSSDLENLRQWRNTKAITQYLSPTPYITEQMQTKWFYNEQKNVASMTFAICFENELIGSLAIYNIADKQAEFGKILIGAENKQGKGIGFLATVMVLDFAFSKLDLNQINAIVYDENISGKKVFLKAGFSVVEQGEELNLVLTKDCFFKTHEFLKEIEVQP